MNIIDFAYRLGLALILGAAVGLERQWRQKSAGLRTNTLVSLGSAAFMLLSLSITSSTGDPSRTLGQIVTGIGFLGAGVIMRDGLNVQGLNTAATIWCSAAVGAFAGVGMIMEATVTAFSIILVHLLFRPLGMKLSSLPFLKTEVRQVEYLFTVKCKHQIENHIRSLLMQSLDSDDSLLLRSLDSIDDTDDAYTNISAKITSTIAQDNVIEKLANRLCLEQDILKVKWEVIGHQSDI